MITPLQNTAQLDLLQAFDPNLQAQQRPQAPAQARDVVHVTTPELMTDEEAEEVMTNVQSTIADSPMDALTVHSGLDLSRVMALLADD